MCFKCIYSIFVIILGIIVFFNEIYLEQYSMYFICFCLSFPLIVFVINKFDKLKIGDFFEFSQRINSLEKQQDIIYKQLSIINHNSINNYNTNITNAYTETVNKNQIQEEKEKEQAKEIKDIKNDKDINMNTYIASEQLLINNFIKEIAPNQTYEPQMLYYTVKGKKRNIFFDAYFQKYNSEYFFEMKTLNNSTWLLGNIKSRVEAIEIYNNLNNRNACLILLLVEIYPINNSDKELIKNKIENFCKNEIPKDILYIEYLDYKKYQEFIQEKEVK